MYDFMLVAILAGFPVADAQGEWRLCQSTTHGPGPNGGGGWVFGGDAKPVWRIKGSRIEDTPTGQRRVIHGLAAIPHLAPPVGSTSGPRAIRLTRYDGAVYEGTYRRDGNKLTLTVYRDAPISDMPGWNGTEEWILELEVAPPPRPNDGLFRLSDRP